MTMDSLNVDVLVCGGGMSGMACASFAAQAGAKVLVAEKQPHVGGSSVYSAGMFWAPKTYEKMRAWIPDGEPELQKAWLGDYLRAVEWMREQGVPTSEQYGPIMTIGVGYPIKIPNLHRLHARRIDDSKSGSRIMVSTKVVKLLRDGQGGAGSRVTGAILQRVLSTATQPPEYIKVSAKLVVLSTGGFQGSAGLRAEYLGPGGDNIFVRANSGSVGDGLKLALSAGAETSRGMATYYGHLMAAPLRKEDITPQDYLPLAQYQSRQCLLINKHGRRFADETTGDEVVNQYLAQQDNRRGFVLFNDAVRAKYCVSSPFPNGGNLDRLAKARQHGCRVAESETVEGLLETLEKWGVNTVETRRTINNYHRNVALGDRSAPLDYPVGSAGSPPASLLGGKGPFFAMEVQPSITFTYGGIAINREGHALTADRASIPGLLVAGVDAGGFSNLGYAGGLALAFVTGYWAAREASRQLQLPIPSLPSASHQDLQSVRETSSSRL